MPIGMVSSPAHILTNPKVKEKGHCLKDCYAQAFKDTGKMVGLTAGAAGAAALATAVTPKGAGFVKNAQKGIEGLIRKVKINDKSLMAKLQKTSLYQKFNALPAPAKAAIGTGLAALAVILPLGTMASAANTGRIEGKYEVEA
jgi:hypothetical protein